MIHFEIPKNQSSIIKVIGVGGGGGNAVNYMHSLGIEGVDFVVCNTDSQALALSPIPNKVQLGPHLTQGLGAGANPEIGKQASEESLEDINKILKVNTKMAFITAGMGGGTGTGGAPVVAKICRELGILTVGIVTLPFTYEGRKRMKQAQEGIDRMREHVDTILIISNDKLRQQFGNLPFTQAFAKADDVLSTAAKCITDIINTTRQINLDFADVCTVMKNGGVAMLGSASVSGENRALHAVEQALNSPLLNDSDINGAKWLLLNITSAPGEFEHNMDEIDAIQAYVQQQAGEGCDVILGMGHDANLGEQIAVTVIATGFNHKEISGEIPVRRNEPAKTYVTLQPLDEPATEKLINQTTTPSSIALNTEHTTNFFDPKPAFPTSVNESTDLTTPSFETTIEIQQTVDNTTPASPLTQFTLHEKAPENEKINTFAAETNFLDQENELPKIGTHFLTPEEVAERTQLDEQKRMLEERAERLRKLSFNIKDTESQNDIENVPAYLRRNIDIGTGVTSAETFYSGYSIGVNDQQNNGQASIQTINTFLDGKKPD
ncbi:MAG: cell division protein FtsZ [Bacteroidetes bacterium]|nr:cell division protein FtsZ [Bacteroidota bacterium]